MVITGTLVSRHRRLSDARATARLNQILHARVMHWRKRDVDQDGYGLKWKRTP